MASKGTSSLKEERMLDKMSVYIDQQRARLHLVKLTQQARWFYECGNETKYLELYHLHAAAERSFQMQEYGDVLNIRYQ